MLLGPKKAWAEIPVPQSPRLTTEQAVVGPIFGPNKTSIGLLKTSSARDLPADNDLLDPKVPLPGFTVWRLEAQHIFARWELFSSVAGIERWDRRLLQARKTVLLEQLLRHNAALRLKGHTVRF